MGCFITSGPRPAVGTTIRLAARTIASGIELRPVGCRRVLGQVPVVRSGTVSLYTRGTGNGDTHSFERHGIGLASEVALAEGSSSLRGRA
jgi:hypothetical protein